MADKDQENDNATEAGKDPARVDRDQAEAGTQAQPAPQAPAAAAAVESAAAQRRQERRRLRRRHDHPAHLAQRAGRRNCARSKPTRPASSLLLTTHKERAELYQEQFTSKGLTVTIEPAESEWRARA